MTSQVALNLVCSALLYAIGMSIGDRLHQLRNQLGLNGERFGELMGVTKGMVSQWEKNIGVPSTDRIMMLRKHITFSIDWLLYGTTNNQPYESLSSEALEFAAEWEALQPDKRAAYKTLLDLDSKHDNEQEKTAQHS